MYETCPLLFRIPEMFFKYWKLSHFQKGAMLEGIDMESLYMSIPHEWGLKGVKYLLENKFALLGVQNELIEILEFMLEHNCFQFLGINYQQLRGTSMGALWAPSYACLHLGFWEEEVVSVPQPQQIVAEVH